MTTSRSQHTTRRGRIRGDAKGLILVLLALGLGSVPQNLWIAPAYAAAPDPNDCLANLPVATPSAPSHRVVQLINCSNQTLLGTANGAFRAGQPSTAVFPREKTWVMQPYNPSKPYKQNGPNGNILTI